jgi:nitrate reductase NapAB chaperone NapD
MTGRPVQTMLSEYMWQINSVYIDNKEMRIKTMKTRLRLYKVMEVSALRFSYT